ncbi:DUF2231 domain-containing protein [bacterium]|nr:MAG: DUF2231 domain-containing protein [bacterium]
MFALPLGLDRFTFELPTLIELHQASVHFPIGLLLTSVFCDAVGGIWKKAAGFRTTAYWTHMLGTVAAAVSVGLGWFGNPVRGQEGKFAQMVAVHQWWGIASLVVFALLAWWRLARREKRGSAESVSYAALSLLGVAIISITGYLGAHLGG